MAKKPKVLEKFHLKIQTVPEGALGLAPYVITGQSDDRTRLIDYSLLSEEQQKRINEGKGDVVDLGQIDMLMVKESGHFPNFMAEYNVYKPLISDSSALIQICPEGMPSCAPYIQVAGKEILIDQSMVPAGLLNKNGDFVSVSVKGYLAEEKGHLPTPTEDSRVFKVIEIKENGVVDGSGDSQIDNSSHSDERSVDENIEDIEDLLNIGSNQ